MTVRKFSLFAGAEFGRLRDQDGQLCGQDQKLRASNEEPHGSNEQLRHQVGSLLQGRPEKDYHRLLAHGLARTDGGAASASASQTASHQVSTKQKEHSDKQLGLEKALELWGCRVRGDCVSHLPPPPDQAGQLGSDASNACSMSFLGSATLPINEWLGLAWEAVKALQLHMDATALHIQRVDDLSEYDRMRGDWVCDVT